jgi:ribonuclease-3
MSKNLEDFEKLININFSNKKLLQQVFIHRSYINEHLDQDIEHNERLEFLGDAVLELVVTEHLYQTYPNPEGELTNWRSAIVKGEMLAKIAKELTMGENLLVSRGEERNGGKSRDLLLANSFEALIGAIYLDQGYEKVKTFIHSFLIVKLKDILEEGSYFDSKSRLQELVQEKEGVTPTYKVLKESGPDHDKYFEIGVYINDSLIGSGEGSSKRKGEQVAATNALEKYL